MCGVRLSFLLAVTLTACGAETPLQGPHNDAGPDVYVPPGCGDGVLDPGEDCDGANLGGFACDFFGYSGGQLECAVSCSFVTTACQGDTICGNGLAEESEDCDGDDLAGASCVSLGYDMGALVCFDNCAFDLNDCESVVACGDDVAEGSEACDMTDLRGVSCISLGYDSGTLACAANCTLDASGCVTDAICGDDVVEDAEACDGLDLRSHSCNSLGFLGGVLLCDASCTLDITNCFNTFPVCGNGTVEVGEACDDGNSTITDDCPDGPTGSCWPATCGDGFVWTGQEACDDGNGSNVDDCPDGIGGTCEWASCGDGFVHALDENCDTTADATCWDCDAFCGDSVLNGPEVCEQPWPDPCGQDCLSGCGDGVVDPTIGEDCDEGVLLPGGTLIGGEGPGCRSDCTFPVCGDGTCSFQGGVETISNCPEDCGCNPVTGEGCVAGEGCIIDRATPQSDWYTTCAPAGTATDLCAPWAPCVVGYLCAGSFCVRYCAPGGTPVCAALQTCSHNFTINGNEWGYCG